jgi:uncharacterized secreted protein with C-terminal beta-propeller domain
MYLTYTTYDQYYPEWQAFSSVYGAYLPEEAKQKIAAIDASEVSGWRKDSLKMAAAGEYAQQMAKGMSASMAEELQKSYYDKLSALQQERARQAEKTAIHKFALSDFSQLAKGEVPGHVLNQFSMDESGEYFRIATTVPQVWNWNGQDALPSSNNLYVLDSKLAVAGKVEDIAPGEQIYSVRFMGSRAYMVTYRQVDPFFVVDLSNPSSPKILGNLKIPGFSNYLHPYDERYIIGVGKETQETKEGQSLVQGVKLSLFDVQDPSTPREVAKVQIGDRGSDSFALTDHKAFLFSKGKGGLLVLPILEAKIDPTKYAGGQFPQWQYGDYVFQGAYVFSLSPENGFQLRGKITHATEEELLKSGQYYWSAANVQRSLYMGSTLYTVSDRFVKANDLESLAAISSVKIAQDPPQGSGYLGPAMPVAKPMAAQSSPESGG